MTSTIKVNTIQDSCEALELNVVLIFMVQVVKQ